jgi:lysophospholipase L1-like esterase
VEILYSMEGPVQVGPFTTTSRGGTRDQGFAFDWALQGAQSYGMVHRQLPGLAAQVAQGKIDYVGIFIGSNDFGSFLRGVSNGAIPAAVAMTNLAQTEKQVEANVGTAVSALLAANPNVQIVVANQFDLSVLPQTQSLRSPLPVLAAVQQAVQNYNDFLAGMAAVNSRVALLDLAGLVGQFVQSAGGTGWAPYGGTAINVARAGDGYNHFILADGIHFGTVAQGMIADAFIQAVDAKFGATLVPLSAQQIVRFASHVNADMV